MIVDGDRKRQRASEAEVNQEHHDVVFEVNNGLTNEVARVDGIEGMTKEQLHMHFLSGGPGSQACREQ